jgi:hypothetical protein
MSATCAHSRTASASARSMVPVVANGYLGKRAARRRAGCRAGYRMTAQVTVLYAAAERTRDREFAQALDA